MARDRRGAVVITGASTGIGWATARWLADHGHTLVFAGVRGEAGAERVRAQGQANLRPLLLDVTDADGIARAVEEVTAAVGAAGLAGLVNNAGIAVPGVQEYLPLDAWRRQLEVNVLGPVAVTKAFLPLLRTGGGRIANVSSISGKAAFPFLAPYCASKHALEAITDALRMELLPWGLHAASVEPGNVVTPIWDKAEGDSHAALDGLPPEGRARYPGVQAMANGLVSRGRAGVPPERVARAIEHALVARRPRLRYVVGPDARAGVVLRWLLPDRVFYWLIRRSAGLS